MKSGAERSVRGRAAAEKRGVGNVDGAMEMTMMDSS